MLDRRQLRQALAVLGADAGPIAAKRLNEALQAGLFAEARDCVLRGWPQLPRDPRIEQLLGLAYRGLLESDAAQQAFGRAAAALPDDPLIAHSQARARLECGESAVVLFERAWRLSPNDLSVLQGRMAALLADRRGGEAIEILASELARRPRWFEGHLTYAQIATAIAAPGKPTASLDRAIQANPRDVALRHTLLRVLIGAGNYGAVLDAVSAARAAVGGAAQADLFEAIALSESGHAEQAMQLFATMPLPGDGDQAIWPIRALIRLGRHADAARLAERDYPPPGDLAVWPYRALLWRLLGDPRWEWLEGDTRLIRTFDLSMEFGEISDLARTLRRLHVTSAPPPEQSVREGTQTDGMLFARAEPEIRRLRQAVRGAVADYIAQLPPPDPRHPTLREPRVAPRFAGSWSVRLSGSGYHVDHVHTQGWISSACYVALPPAVGAQDEAGWLTFGENRALLPELDAFRTIRPQPGLLVLFPSTTWHGTRPFADGERLTVAFDIARPGA